MEIKPIRFREQAEAPVFPEPEPPPDDAPLRERIIAAIRTVYDPEIPVNVYDLGLIYSIELGDDGVVLVDMTLTAPACPVAGILPGQVRDAIRAVKDVRDARVELVWDPPWNRDRISDEAKLALGLF